MSTSVRVCSCFAFFLNFVLTQCCLSCSEAFLFSIILRDLPALMCLALLHQYDCLNDLILIKFIVQYATVLLFFHAWLIVIFIIKDNAAWIFLVSVLLQHVVGFQKQPLQGKCELKECPL